MLLPRKRSSSFAAASASAAARALLSRNASSLESDLSLAWTTAGLEKRRAAESVEKACGPSASSGAWATRS